MQPIARALDGINARYDVIVIGSGYGGGVAASRLARAGRRVAVLERGREILPGDFPARMPDMRRDLQISGGERRVGPATALYDFRLGKHIHVLLGCGLGGGSLVNAGVALRPDPKILRDPVWPHALGHDGLLEEGFTRAEAWLRPARHGEARSLAKFRALERVAEAFGRPAEPAPVTVGFEDGLNAAGIEQPACTLCGDCCGGCNVGAKTTVAATYLADAAAHAAEIFTEVEVHRLERQANGCWRIFFHPVGKGGGGARAADTALETVEAEIVVLAAGTLGSTQILLRSRAAGLALSARLGERFSANGDIIAFGYDGAETVNAIGIGHPPKVEIGPVGACVSGQIVLAPGDAGAPDIAMTIQEGVLPSSLAPLLPVFFIPGGRLIGAAKALVLGVYKGPLARTQTWFVVSHDAAAGRLVLEGGHLRVHWPGVSRQPVYARIDATLETAAAAAGGTYLRNPLSETITGSKPTTAHPLGGCGMGADRMRGVVDHKGRVFDGAEDAGVEAVHEGLYVCDGAIISRSLGVNPLLTITALAERAMIHLAADHGWTFDPAPMQA